MAYKKATAKSASAKKPGARALPRAQAKAPAKPGARALPRARTPVMAPLQALGMQARAQVPGVFGTLEAAQAAAKRHPGFEVSLTNQGYRVTKSASSRK